MAAIAAVEGVVSDETIRTLAAEFGGVEHRIELVREKDGVRYYNDSIASSPTRTIAGLRSFDEKLILIAGGYDKHIPYDVLGPEIVEHVKTLVLTGATAEKIRQAVLAAPGYRPGCRRFWRRRTFTTPSTPLPMRRAGRCGCSRPPAPLLTISAISWSGARNLKRP